jgi:hypothetical protein
MRFCGNEKSQQWTDNAKVLCFAHSQVLCTITQSILEPLQHPSASNGAENTPRERDKLCTLKLDLSYLSAALPFW